MIESVAIPLGTEGPAGSIFAQIFFIIARLFGGSGLLLRSRLLSLYSIRPGTTSGSYSLRIHFSFKPGIPLAVIADRKTQAVGSKLRPPLSPLFPRPLFSTRSTSSLLWILNGFTLFLARQLVSIPGGRLGGGINSPHSRAG